LSGQASAEKAPIDLQYKWEALIRESKKAETIRVG